MNETPRRPAGRRLALTVGASLGLLSLIGCSVMRAPPQAAATDQGGGSGDIALYRSVIDRVRADYVEPVGEDKLVANSLKGMLTGLDPHSDYMTEAEYQEMLDDSEGEFAGIGAELTRDGNVARIITPIDGTPAARAGIEPGDIILRIDGKLTEGMTLTDVVDTLRGPPGSTVRLTIGRRGSRPFDVTLVRTIIHVDSVKAKLEPGDIGYARISSFGDRTQHELVRAIDRLSHQAGGRLRGFVLDLRNDPGGLLDESVHVAGDFLDGGTVVSTRGRDPDDDRVYSAPSNGDRLAGVPVVVLINGASASASEIVAGALQDRRRATILGTRSFGKGSVQTIIPLDGHGALRLTTARYYTPSGRSIQDEGITPDQRVLLPKNEQAAGVEEVHEADLRGALKNPALGKTTVVQDEKAEGTISPVLIGTPQDYQLSQALLQVRAMAEHPRAARAQQAIDGSTRLSP